MNLKKNFLTILVLLGMFLPVVYVFKYENDKKKEISITHPSASDPHAHPSVTIVYKTQLPDSLKTVLETTVRDYDLRYTLLDTLFITDTIVDYKYHSDTSSQISIAYGSPKTICLNKIFLKKGKTDTTLFRFTVAHELFHTLGSMYLEMNPYYVNPVFVINGYRGLTMWMNLDKPNIRFSLLEEASAEMCAYYLYPDYMVQSMEYQNIGFVLKAMIDSNWVKPKDLIEATKGSNPPKIISLLTNKSQNDLSRIDIVRIMNLFKKAYDNKNCYSELNELSRSRIK